MAEGKISHGFMSYRTDQETWLSALIDAKGDTCEPDADRDPGCVYLIAFYWGMMTLTGVGYGDIVPQNKMEYFTSILCMVIAGFTWTYIVGTIVAILSNIDPHSVEFKQNVDDLNQLMERRDLPNELRIKLRTYMHLSRDFSKVARQRCLLERIMSRGLQREVAAWSPEVQSILRGVWWVRGLEEAAILEIVRALQPNSFGPSDTINLPETMFVIHKGIAGVKGRILSRGDVWGAADVLLETRQLVESAMPRTISYVEVFMLTKRSILEVCRSFPRADQRIRRAQIRTAVLRAFIRAADQIKMRRRGASRPMSSDALSDASSGSFLHPGMKWIDLALESRQGEEERVDLPELKRLLLQVMQQQNQMAIEFKQQAKSVDCGLTAVADNFVPGAAQVGAKVVATVSHAAAVAATRPVEASKQVVRSARNRIPTLGKTSSFYRRSQSPSIGRSMQSFEHDNSKTLHEL